MGNDTTPGTPEGSNKKVPAPAGRDMVTLTQFQSLLSAVNTFMAFLANAHLDPEHMPHKGPMDGGVKVAAENTFIGLCNRVDKMIADETRWSMDEQNNLEQSLLILYADQRAFIKNQREAVAIMKSPHNRMKPMLVKLDGGVWAAVYGDPTNESSMIIGTGLCPEDALANFDDVFAGKIYEKNKTMDGIGREIPKGKPRKTDGKTDGKAPGKDRRIRAKKAAKQRPPSGDDRHCAGDCA